MTKPELIGLRQVAEDLGIHYMTAYRYVRTGALEAEQHQGRWWVTPEELERFLSRRADQPNAPGRPPANAPKRTVESLSTRRRDALAKRMLHGDQPGAWKIIDDALAGGAPIRDINTYLLSPALALIGEAWSVGTVSVGEEHRATAVAQRLISSLGNRFTRRGRRSGAAVLSAMTGDRHGLPSAILSDLLRADGIDAIDLGADTPINDVVGVAMSQDRLVAVGICATTPLDRRQQTRLVDAVETIRNATGRPVLLGGAAVSSELADRAQPDHWSHDANDAVDWLLETSRAAGR